MVNRNIQGQPLIDVGLTGEELQELILLIDDEPVDEVLLRGIRQKLKNRQRRLRRTLRIADQKQGLAVRAR